jgi:hypothetical protein
MALGNMDQANAAKSHAIDSQFYKTSDSVLAILVEASLRIAILWIPQSSERQTPSRWR